MSEATDLSNFGQRATRAVDWMIFSLGVLSLSIAIGATVLSKTSHLQSDASPKAERLNISL